MKFKYEQRILILVDTLGLLLTVFVHDAHRSAQAGFQLLCSWVKGLFPRLQLIWVDGTYRVKPEKVWYIRIDIYIGTRPIMSC